VQFPLICSWPKLDASELLFRFRLSLTVALRSTNVWNASRHSQCAFRFSRSSTAYFSGATGGARGGVWARPSDQGLTSYADASTGNTGSRSRIYWGVLRETEYSPLLRVDDTSTQKTIDEITCNFRTSDVAKRVTPHEEVEKWACPRPYRCPVTPTHKIRMECWPAKERRFYRVRNAPPVSGGEPWKCLFGSSVNIHSAIHVGTERRLSIGDRRRTLPYPTRAVYLRRRSSNRQMCGLDRAERLHFIRVDETGGAWAIPNSTNPKQCNSAWSTYCRRRLE